MMTVDKTQLSKKEILVKHRITLIIIGLIAISYISIASYMGNLRPFAVVRSESMVPTLEKGDLILIRVVSIDSIKLGDIIVFDVPSPYNIPSPVIHRIINIGIEDGKKIFETKGDNNVAPDFFKVPAENVIGKYAEIRIPTIGLIFLFLQSTLGLITIILLIVILFIYSYIDTKNRDLPEQLT